MPVSAYCGQAMAAHASIDAIPLSLSKGIVLRKGIELRIVRRSKLREFHDPFRAQILAFRKQILGGRDLQFPPKFGART